MEGMLLKPIYTKDSRDSVVFNVTFFIVWHMLLDQSQQVMIVVDGHKHACLMHALYGLAGQDAHNRDACSNASGSPCMQGQTTEISGHRLSFSQQTIAAHFPNCRLESKSDRMASGRPHCLRTQSNLA